ncbi:hypothetical protein PRK78_002023 [Emydomyces testavorans]|uniref:HTH araC/xylS-type domain-containing protein n=1 Tax=Emydomyces testavorans TaxID=2070801 RepID=A0AAF0IHF7_9EURO|nr:hypothetical protein PRK78_002023 [Emydomyces testavorans]
MTQTVDNKMAYATPSARWRAIVNRDAAATGFVYGVRTTKIYCRPRCPARLARRANVIFYDTPALAEKAGYRPCKRCKPEDLRAPTDPHIRLAQKACETMTLAALAGGEKQRPTLHDLATEAGLTPSHFHRVFKKVVGVTPGKYARDMLEGKTFQKKLPDGSIIGWPPVGPIRTGTSATQLQAQTKVETQTPLPLPTSHPAPVQGIGLDPSNQFNGHDPISVGFDWNEFDLMLAATPGGTRPQMDYIGNGGFCVPAMDRPFLDPGPVVDGSMFAASPQLSSELGFPDYVNDTAGLSLGTPLFDSLTLPTRPTSVPSSQQSLSLTDSPPLLESCDSPLLFEDVDWLENSGLFHSYQ